MHIFKEASEEESYLRWVEANQHGFVVNAPMRTGDMVLHRAQCGSITSPLRQNYVGRDYYKVCSPEKQELIAWAKTQPSSHLRGCGLACCRGVLAQEERS